MILIRVRTSMYLRNFVAVLAPPIKRTWPSCPFLSARILRAASSTSSSPKIT